MATQSAVAPLRVRFPAPADDLCLAFANTRYWRGSPQPAEDLRDLGNVLRWAETNAGLPGCTHPWFSQAWPAGGAEENAFIEALSLRETMFRLFAAVASKQDCAPADIAALNAALAKAPGRERLALEGGEHGWEAVLEPPSIPAMLAPALWSAADLLLGPRAARVRQCANPACLWLFLDDSKSGNRRWCSMTSCGNRAKAHRHYLKQKTLARDAEPGGAG
jgi:predicted RNA-binding Zn ribbon-like protein